MLNVGMVILPFEGHIYHTSYTANTARIVRNVFKEQTSPFNVQDWPVQQRPLGIHFPRN